MPLSLSPILNFQGQHKAVAEELSKVMRTGFMATSMSFALSEMAYRNASKEEMIGAKIFIGVLMNLAEPLPIPPPSLPDKELRGQTDFKKQ